MWGLLIFFCQFAFKGNWAVWRDSKLTLLNPLSHAILVVFVTFGHVISRRLVTLGHNVLRSESSKLHTGRAFMPFELILFLWFVVNTKVTFVCLWCCLYGAVVSRRPRWGRPTNQYKIRTFEEEIPLPPWACEYSLSCLRNKYRIISPLSAITVGCIYRLRYSAALGDLGRSRASGRDGDPGANRR